MGVLQRSRQWRWGALTTAAVLVTVLAGALQSPAVAADTTPPTLLHNAFAPQHVVYSSLSNAHNFWLRLADPSGIANVTMTLTNRLGEVETYSGTGGPDLHDDSDIEEVWHVETRTYSRVDNKRFGRWDFVVTAKDRAGNTTTKSGLFHMRGRTAFSDVAVAPSSASTATFRGRTLRVTPLGYRPYANRYVRVHYRPFDGCHRYCQPGETPNVFREVARVLTAADGTFSVDLPSAPDGMYRAWYPGTTYFTRQYQDVPLRR